MEHIPLDYSRCSSVAASKQSLLGVYKPCSSILDGSQRSCIVQQNFLEDLVEERAQEIANNLCSRMSHHFTDPTQNVEKPRLFTYRIDDIVNPQVQRMMICHVEKNLKKVREYPGNSILRMDHSMLKAGKTFKKSYDASKFYRITRGDVQVWAWADLSKCQVDGHVVSASQFVMRKMEEREKEIGEEILRPLIAHVISLLNRRPSFLEADLYVYRMANLESLIDPWSSLWVEPKSEDCVQDDIIKNILRRLNDTLGGIEGLYGKVKSTPHKGMPYTLDRSNQSWEIFDDQYLVWTWFEPPNSSQPSEKIEPRK